MTTLVGSASERSAQSEIDHLMKQIEELQKQMALLAIPPRRSSISKRILASVSQAAQLAQNESSSQAGLVQPEEPSKEAESMVTQPEGESPPQSIESVVQDEPKPAPPGDDFTFESLMESMVGAPIDKGSKSPEKEPEKKNLVDEASELFKEIEGGEDALLAETLAGLPSVENAASRSSAPVSAPEPVTEKGEEPKTGGHRRKTVPETLESESLLAEVLDISPQGPPALGSALSPITMATSNSRSEPIESREEAKKESSMNSVKKGSSSDHSLSMTVTGQMSLKLNFEYEGQEILVQFNQDLICLQFSDGSEFKIPVNRNPMKKAAA